mmetsp:Transcript_17568/g.42248  ORF Transcript_17568/g.42248 Transcript_17568/m.42248 type:complete len:218 (+) Transcript_17568:575-1228(+)
MAREERLCVPFRTKRGLRSMLPGDPPTRRSASWELRMPALARATCSSVPLTARWNSNRERWPRKSSWDPPQPPSLDAGDRTSPSWKRSMVSRSTSDLNFRRRVWWASRMGSRPPPRKSPPSRNPSLRQRPHRRRLTRRWRAGSLHGRSTPMMIPRGGEKQITAHSSRENTGERVTCDRNDGTTHRTPKVSSIEKLSNGFICHEKHILSCLATGILVH